MGGKGSRVRNMPTASCGCCGMCSSLAGGKGGGKAEDRGKGGLRSQRHWRALETASYDVVPRKKYGGTTTREGKFG